MGNMIDEGKLDNPLKKEIDEDRILEKYCSIEHPKVENVQYFMIDSDNSQIKVPKNWGRLKSSKKMGIIDEKHEFSYKEVDKVPSYDKYKDASRSLRFKNGGQWILKKRPVSERECWGEREIYDFFKSDYTVGAFRSLLSFYEVLTVISINSYHIAIISSFEKTIKQEKVSINISKLDVHLILMSLQSINKYVIDLPTYVKYTDSVALENFKFLGLNRTECVDRLTVMFNNYLRIYEELPEFGYFSEFDTRICYL